MIFAVVESKIDIIQELIAQKANVNPQAIIDGKTPLMWASGAGNFLIAKELIKTGADVNLKGGELDGSALIYAANAGHFQVALVLVEVGADIKILLLLKELMLIGMLVWVIM